MSALTAERLRDILLYAPKRGVFYWIKPPTNHSELLGEMAGAPRASRGKQYWVIKINGKAYPRSRLAWLYMSRSHPREQIDHINGDSLDDRWVNLREATVTQNAWNHSKRKRKKDFHLPMGVCTADSGKYRARISYQGRDLLLGTFNTVEEARNVYVDARRKLYGEFSGL